MSEKPDLQSGWRAVHRFDCIDSTSTWLKQNKSPHKTACVAEQQTSGRGRHGKAWFSPAASNIYLSCNWRFEPQLPNPGLLSLWVGIAVADVLSDLGLIEHGVKWPNDIYWRQRKLGGILIEGSHPHTGWIIGLGLNVNMPDDGVDIDQPWASVSEALGKEIDKESLLISLLHMLHDRLSALSALGFEELSRRWDAYNLLDGKAVTFSSGTEKMSGTVQGINQQGELCLTLLSGELRAFNSSISEIRW